MNPSYQYANGAIRGEEATQRQGEDKQDIGNRASPPASLGDALPSLTPDSIKKEYDTTTDKHAKKNRNNMAQELRDQGYIVSCGRTTNLRGWSIYLLDAYKKTMDENKKEESVHV